MGEKSPQRGKNTGLSVNGRPRHTPSRTLVASGIPPERTLEFRRSLQDWFGIGGRRFPWRDNGASTYLQVVSEILLQQTPALRVATFVENFVGRFHGWEDLASADESDLAAYLRPLGLWRRRARILIALGRAMGERAGSFPATRDELEGLPAIGQYVASAILLFAWNKPEPLLDVNMARVLERYFGRRKLSDIRHDPYLQALAREVVAVDPVSTNWAILDLGATLCRARAPQCLACPLLGGCSSAVRRRRECLGSGARPGATPEDTPTTCGAGGQN
ncbi:MAG: HhH-GPD family protein [Chloroflexota bacterium]